LKELRKKEKIAAVLNDFTHNKLSADVLGSLTELVYDNSKTFGYDPFLVLAVIHVESMFDPQALGKYRSGKYSGAFGLMQLKVETAKEVGARLGITITSKEDLFVPEINIALGVAYLTKQISKFKSLKLGILAYNQGPGVILDNLKYRTPLSIRYYNKVLKSYFKLKKMENQ
jgi:soluble lytic murein transglycosylase-like protein